MLISLSEIMTKEDKVERIQVPIEMDKFEFQGVNYEFAEKNLVELKISNIGKKKVLLEGKLSIALKFLCDRCLKEIIFPMNIDIFKELDFNETDIEDEETESLEEISYIIRYDLDVDILIYNEIIVRFPMKVVCDDECKGLCKSCGINLNEKTCDCDTTVYDPRMAVIQDIFNNYKEV